MSVCLAGWFWECSNERTWNVVISLPMKSEYRFPPAGLRFTSCLVVTWSHLSVFCVFVVLLDFSLDCFPRPENVAIVEHFGHRFARTFEMSSPRSQWKRCPLTLLSTAAPQPLHRRRIFVMNSSTDHSSTLILSQCVAFVMEMGYFTLLWKFRHPSRCLPVLWDGRGGGQRAACFQPPARRLDA